VRLVAFCEGEVGKAGCADPVSCIAEATLDHIDSFPDVTVGAGGSLLGCSMAVRDHSVDASTSS
jgi:hypothetical protein